VKAPSPEGVQRQGAGTSLGPGDGRGGRWDTHGRPSHGRKTFLPRNRFSCDLSLPPTGSFYTGDSVLRSLRSDCACTKPLGLRSYTVGRLSGLWPGSCETGWFSAFQM
jgi:hypothetical protein